MVILDDIISGLFNLGKTYIDNKEKQAEFNNEVAKMGLQLQERMLTSQTMPKVDAIVKLMYAFREIAIPMFRPIGGALLTAASIYCAVNRIQLDPTVNTILASAFPGWMASRGLEKLTSKDK